MAVMVMALVLASAFAVFRRNVHVVETARNVTIAGQIMQTELERLRMKDWATVGALTDGSVAIDSAFTSNPVIGNRFSMNRTVTSPKADMLQIVLAVSWQASLGQVHTRSYTIRYARYGMYDYFYNTK